MVKTIIKRDGRTAEFHPEKIADAVEKSFQACAAMQGRDTAEKIAATVVEKLESGAIEGTPTVEGVQDLVEETLIESGFVQTAKAYILYRAERSRVRDVNSRLIQTLKDITFSKAADSDMKRENANIDADTAMGTMLKYGSESAKQFYEMCVIDPRYAKAHREGDIHIHDMDFYTLKGCVEAVLKDLRISDISFEVPSQVNPSYHPGRCADVYAGERRIGVIGQIHPLVAQNYGVDAQFYCAELELNELLCAKGPDPEYVPLPKFPAVTRDIAVVCDEAVTVGQLEKAIRKGAKGLLKDCALFDIYRGKGVPEGKKSVAFRLTLRADDRSLTAEEADADVKSILAALESELGARLR